MCGIAGILTAPALPDAMDRTLRMQRALAHRGPDGNGGWCAPDGSAAVAHTRLAVIDTTAGGRQPMSIDQLTLVMNGEIYNFRELQRDLQQRGVTFKSSSDGEVVLRAYQAWGGACVERLRGMFSLAIWDQANHCCLLARDRFGIKPLYYADQGGRLIFASELRAILASGLVPAEIDAQAAYGYFRTGSVQEPRTLIRGVQELPAGHSATWQRGQLRSRRYWEFSFGERIAAPDAAAATRQALLDSVRHHFAADVPVGIFLSGGVDSTGLLALAAELGRFDVRALTMALPGTAADECELAARTARHFGVEHHICSVDAGSGRALFEESQRAMDQPSIDGMNTLAVSRLAHAVGLKVVLSGVGADELFGGYPAARGVPALYSWHRRLASALPIGRPLGAAIELLPDTRCHRLGEMLAQTPSLERAYATYRGIFTRAEARGLTRELLGTDAVFDDVTEPLPDDPTLEDASCRLELTRYLRNQLLRDTDVMGMACGVEIRVPYLDEAVVNTVTQIPQGQRLGAGKQLLRDAIVTLPEWVRRQPKRGFMFPIDRWLAGEWTTIIEDEAWPTGVARGPWYRQACIRAFTEFVGRTRAHASNAVVRPLPLMVEAET